jgi:8-amino-7-oxononanoate synthase
LTSLEASLVRQLQQLDQTSQRRIRRTVEFVSSTECLVDGRLCTSFGTNDYLGLSRHSRVISAFAAAAVNQFGAGASALIAGRSPAYVKLEEAIAAFESTEAATLFPSGFAANTGTLTSLIGTGDAVFCDRENHASLIDGCRASAGKFFVYNRDNLPGLHRSIQRRRHEFSDVFIATDSVFSMDGMTADLPQLCDIADRFDARLIVDEAHGTGVFGASGRGVCELQQVEHRVSVRIGTLSKAIGGLGGFVAGSETLCEWLWNTARSQFFSTALPPAVCAAATEALQVIRDEPQRLRTLAARSTFARQEMVEAGLSLMPVQIPGPIIAVLLGDNALAGRVNQRLLRRGVFVPAVRPPTVPAGTARLRFAICCDHSEEQIRAAVYQLRDVLHSEQR